VRQAVTVRQLIAALFLIYVGTLFGYNLNSGNERKEKQAWDSML
jgi:hypothetical protein